MHDDELADLVPGATVVVSPLIALQQDQVAAIGDDLGGARQVNSWMTNAQRRQAFGDFGDGNLEFLFVAPEQLANEETLERIKAIGPSLFVVDEAHCISAWGHDFRPDYLRLGSFIEALGRPRVLRPAERRELRPLRQLRPGRSRGERRRREPVRRCRLPQPVTRARAGEQPPRARLTTGPRHWLRTRKRSGSDGSTSTFTQCLSDGP